LADRILIVGIHDNTGFSAPIEYTLDSVLSVYGINYKVIYLDEYKPEEYDPDDILAVTYGRERINGGFKKQVHIYSSGFFGSDYLKPASLPDTPLKKYRNLPVIYPGSGKFDGWVRKSDNLIETNIDIIASSFFMLSRYEEVVVYARDKHERFPATASLAYREGFLQRPIVNEYVEFLWSCIKALSPELKRRPLWPENREFAMCLTHDVDFVRKYSCIPPLLTIGGAVIKNRNPRLAKDILLEYLAALLSNKRDPYNTFDYMLNLEQARGLTSSFYFMSEKTRYNIDQKGIKRLIKQIENAGCEVGLHGGYFSYDNPEEMDVEKACLDEVVNNKSYGCRQHYLRWKTPDTWRIQEKLGFLYDTSLSYADHIGFRCGICLPFKPYDVGENRKLDIWELPLIIMDGSLQGTDYQNLPPDAAFEEMVKTCDTVKKYRGVFTLLWHNSSLDTLGAWKGWKDAYEKFVEYAGGQNVWSASGRGVIEWWLRRTMI
jgi:hypothetical protein